MFYSYEFIPNFSKVYSDGESRFYDVKNKNKKALNKLKASAKGTKEYQEYLEVNKVYREVSAEFKQIKKEERFFGFDSFQLFSTEFFTTVAIFFYVFFNLVRSYRVERNNIGIRIIHYVLLFYCFFQFFWIFKTLADFSKLMYYLFTLGSTYFVALAVWIYEKQRVKIISKLKEDRVKLSFYGMKYAKEDKKESMIDVVKKVAKS
ncbi:hypothetical protein BTO06_00920 [Tenacibaculum sp. SZ-18]|uniref:hypothetical protein n=1 Tax=Tenacibaculum sp. SZ-18 TaxID=754423 RepID=UPI000C2D5400|nr:hypothetical protein [Tenacibaculum sp. SZ-18]AUC13796.1 hypothetical protein BTO06_00920 [Tenacibaculum sp. SZ-18]